MFPSSVSKCSQMALFSRCAPQENVFIPHLQRSPSSRRVPSGSHNLSGLVRHRFLKNPPPKECPHSDRHSVLRGCGAAARVTQNICDQNNCITKRRWARRSRGRWGADGPQFLKRMERRCKPATEYFVSSLRSSHCLRRTQQMRKCPLHSGRQAGAPLLGSSCAPLGM